MTEWTVYMVRSARDAIYTGIAKDVAKRLRKHNSGKGSKCLRGQLPVELVWQSPKLTHSDALSLEYFIKVMGRWNKIDVIEGRQALYKPRQANWGFARVEYLDSVGARSYGVDGCERSL